MRSPADIDDLPMPEGFRAIPIDGPRRSGASQLCALCCVDSPEKAAPVELRRLPGARVLLACLLDAEDRAFEWLELWVQDPASFTGAPSRLARPLTNADAETWWNAALRAARASLPARVLATGFERRYPPPTLLDPIGARALVPSLADGEHPLELCTDEPLLESRGLPSFLASPHRYLHAPGLGADSPLVAASPDAPPGSASIRDIMPQCEAMAPFNLGAGFLHARRLAHVSFETLVDIFSGRPWPGLTHGRAPLPIPEASSPAAPGDGRLLLSRRDGGERLAETLHLKLRALADGVKAVHDAVEAAGAPFFTLTASSFEACLSRSGAALPHLWTARVQLAEAPGAMRAPVSDLGAACFVPVVDGVSSIYAPVAASPVRGRADVRIRRVIDEAAGAVVEGTLTTHERIEPDERDLLWVQLPDGAGGLSLYCRVSRDSALAPAELRFRSLPRRDEPVVRAAIAALEGVPVPGAPFELVALRTTPSDLYSLAVLSIRTLLASEQFPLPVALDEVLSLARAVGDAPPGGPLPERLDALFESDPRWIETLGPHRLSALPVDPRDALSGVPRTLWTKTLSYILRMFPGGPESACNDLTDAPPNEPHAVFRRAIADLDHLLVCSRSLIVVDWAANREIHAVLRQHALGLA